MKFQLLTVQIVQDTAYAVLQKKQLIGQNYREGLKQDCLQLSQVETAAVWLDLRMVELIDGAFPGILLRLFKALKERQIRLTVQASANLREVFRVLKFDQLFDVVSEVDDKDTEDPPKLNTASDNDA